MHELTYNHHPLSENFLFSIFFSVKLNCTLLQRKQWSEFTQLNTLRQKIVDIFHINNDLIKGLKELF